MKITVDLPGLRQQIDMRGSKGFFEGTIYGRVETMPANEAKADVYFRLTAVAIAAEGAGLLLECVHRCGIDYNGKYAGTEEAYRLQKEFGSQCEQRGLKLLHGRIEAQ